MRIKIEVEVADGDGAEVELQLASAAKMIMRGIPRGSIYGQGKGGPFSIEWSPETHVMGDAAVAAV